MSRKRIQLHKCFSRATIMKRLPSGICGGTVAATHLVVWAPAGPEIVALALALVIAERWQALPVMGD